MKDNNKNLLLQANDLTVYYGLIKALDRASFNVNVGEIIALLGPNGAGKSTALKVVSGLIGEYRGDIKSGNVIYKNKNITNQKTYELVKEGISLVPEGRQIFSTMTVLENLEMGAFTLEKEQESLKDIRMEKVVSLFPILKGRYKQKAGTLSSGEQQMLSIGRALMLEPDLLILDEPSLGLSPNYVKQVFDKLVEINKSGTSILLVEQKAKLALNICDRAYVFDIGTIAIEGTGKELKNNLNIKNIYFGE